MSKEELKTIGLAVLGNCVMMGCFTTLAIVFNKWWIILFSIIFWVNVSFKSKGGNK